MCSQVKLNSYEGSCEWLDVGFEFKSRELVDLVENNFAHFGEADNLAELLSRHVIKVVPLELGFLLNLTGYIFQVEHLSELSQRSHRAPETLLYHLAHVQHNLSKIGPSSS